MSTHIPRGLLHVVSLRNGAKPDHRFHAHRTICDHAQKGAVLIPHYSLLHVVNVCPSVLFVACAVKPQESPQGLRGGVIHLDLAAPVGVLTPLCLNVKSTVWLSTAITHLSCLVSYATKWSSVIASLLKHGR